jgi:uncharacterized protein (TIGR02466 family)
MKIETIFTSFLASVALPEIDNDILTDYGFSLKEKTQGVIKSNCYGWQSDRLTDPCTEVSKLVTSICEYANVVRKNIGLNVDNELFMTNIWMNINQGPAFNRPHLHEDSTLSGVYYVKAEPDDGKIVFQHPAANFTYHVNEDVAGDLNEFTSSNWRFTPSPGMLLIFPSYLIHYVEPSLNFNKRISIAFNLSIKK